MPITIHDLAEGSSEVTFTYEGHEIHVQYRADKITKQFRERTLRLAREGTRISRRAEELTTKIRTVLAPDGSPEAVVEDEAAEEAIKQLQVDDDILKRKIDEVICTIVDKWDVMGEDKKMLPLTPEAVYPIPADFERRILEAIIDRVNEGEANGRQSTKPSLSILKQRDERDI